MDIISSLLTPQNNCKLNSPDLYGGKETSLRGREIEGDDDI